MTTALLLLPAPDPDCDCPGCLADAIRVQDAMSWPERRAHARNVLKHRFPDIAHPMLCRWLSNAADRLDNALWNPALTPMQKDAIINDVWLDLIFASDAATPNGGPNSR